MAFLQLGRDQHSPSRGLTSATAWEAFIRSRRLGAAQSPDGPEAPQGCDKFLTSQTICTNAALGHAAGVTLGVTLDVTQDMLWMWHKEFSLPWTQVLGMCLVGIN